MAKTNNRFKRRLYLYVVLSVCLIVSIVFVTVHGSTLGAELAYLEDEEETLTKNISEAKDTLARSESLSDYAQKADELGFVKPENVIYIGQEKEFAANR